MKAIFLGLVFLVLGGCSEEPTPEARVRAFIDEMAASAEARSWLDFRTYVADAYQDSHGLNKKAVLGLIARYLLAHQQVYLLTRVPQVRIDREMPLEAQAIIYAAMAGQPIGSAQELAGIRADTYRFALEIAEQEDGELAVVSGRWQSVPTANFLLGN